MKRPFHRFLGVDLGGSRGKTTAVAEIRLAPSGPQVVGVAKRAKPWTDENLVQRLGTPDPQTVIAIDAPLTQTACNRCEVPVCPGVEACVDPAVVWLRTDGRALVRVAAEQVSGTAVRTTPQAQARLVPYAHRATEVVLAYERQLLPHTALGASNSVVSARALQLRRRLRSAGFELHHNLLEVSPAATVASLVGVRAARGYKRDADPWVTRAQILAKLDLVFAPQSRMAREEVLGDDHAFDAVLSAYTAYLWARDGWEAPTGWFADDGWIAAPP